jgi:hypothetical protein
MAQQATVKRASKSATSVDSDRVSAEASKAKKGRTFDYSKYRQSFQNSDAFAEYLHGYPNKNGLMAYVYRLVPSIDFNLIGRQETNILETATPAEMTAQFILSKFGRGKYMLKLNDANRAKGETEVCRTWFKLEDEEKAPVYDVRTLRLNHPDNLDEVNRQIAAGALVRDAQGVPRIRTDADGAPVASNNSTNGAGELLSRDMVGQVLLKLVTQGVESPGERMKQSIEIAKLLAPPAGPAFSVDQIADQVAARLSLNGGSRPADDPFETWERIERFLGRARGTAEGLAAPAAAAATEGSWVRDAIQFITAVAQATPLVLSTVDQLQRRRMAAAPAAANGQTNGGGQQLPQLSFKDRVVEVLTLGFTKMNEGVDGWAFAAYVCIHHPGGLEVYKFLEPNGTAGVLGLCAMDPAAAPIISDPARRPMIESFLNDFFNYDTDGGSGEDEDAASAAAPAV